MCCISYCLHRRLRDADGSCNTMFVGATADSLPESLEERGNRRGVLRERNREYRGTSRVSWESIPYLSPVRFLPSIMTLLKIRLIRVW
jgi:hypothetical protein